MGGNAAVLIRLITEINPRSARDFGLIWTSLICTVVDNAICHCEKLILPASFITEYIYRI